MVTIIDYGIGNLRSIEKAFEAVGAKVLRTDRPEDLRAAERLVLPGVGAYGACVGEVRRRNLEEPILEAVASGKPFLGVCVGMQMLFEFGEEMGIHRGLGILPGRIVRFTGESSGDGADCSIESSPESGAVVDIQTRTLKVPHMGWNTVAPTRESPLLDGLPETAFFYFVHSYYAVPVEPGDVLGITEYGTAFPAIVNRNNVFGVQFHPEKSQQNGLLILENFSRLPAR